MKYLFFYFHIHGETDRHNIHLEKEKASVKQRHGVQGMVLDWKKPSKACRIWSCLASSGSWSPALLRESG